jgi:hypothetical protein
LGIFQSQAEVDSYVGADGVTKLQPGAKPGDTKFANLNNDNIINPDDRTYIGNPNPTVSYGLTVNVGYKNFDFVVFGSGSGGNQIFQGLRRLDIACFKLSNQIYGCMDNYQHFGNIAKNC